MTENNSTLTIYLDSFEGPLDLLLHLIKDLRVDIFDIPMVEITKQYLTYLHAMKELELNVAGDYLLMAATLLEIKSRMLLPKKEMDVEEIYEREEDPREELVNQLLEYKQIQGAAKLLKELQVEREQLFTKPITNLESHQQSIPLIPGEVSTADLLLALQKMQQKIQRKKPLQTHVNQEKLSIETTMATIVERLLQSQKESVLKVAFTDFFENPIKAQMINTFLAMLELVKERKISFSQVEVYGEIYLELLSEGTLLC